MDKITVSNSIAEKIKRFPKKVYLCDEQGSDLPWFIERIDPTEIPEEQTLAVPEIEQAIREIFLNT